MQRPLKFAKYLKQYGWEPIILAPEPGIYHMFDASLVSELKEASIRVERVKNSRLFQFGKKKRAVKQKKRWLSGLLKWITSWFFLPDNKKGWIEPAVEKAAELIKKESIEAIFSTAPPYSNLLIARHLRNKTGVPVVMDLRDDWLESHLIRYPTRWHYNKMKSIERKTLQSADLITVVNDFYQSRIKERMGVDCPEIKTIPNGYDHENFEGIIPAGDKKTFSILYSGLFYGSRKPDWFLKSTRLLMETNPDFKDDIELQFQGGLDKSHWKVINDLGLSTFVTDFGYLDHQQAVQNLVNADLLFLTLGDRRYIQSVTPGKIFEYMGSLKPIIAYIPEGISQTLLDEYGAATCVGIKDVEAGAEAIFEYYKLWKSGTMPEGNQQFVLRFERRYTAKQLAEFFNQISGRKKNETKRDF